MSKLKKIFEVRDSIFEEKTKEIFELIHTSLVCVTEFLNGEDPWCAAGTISWEDANVMDDLVVIIGMVEYTTGTEIEVDNNTIKITEENVNHFQRVVHMSLPFELVESCNENDIANFLQTMGTQVDSSEFSNIVDGIPESQSIPPGLEFDLTKLTEEQRSALKMYNQKEKN